MTAASENRRQLEGGDDEDEGAHQCEERLGFRAAFGGFGEAVDSVGDYGYCDGEPDFPPRVR